MIHVNDLIYMKRADAGESPKDTALDKKDMWRPSEETTSGRLCSDTEQDKTGSSRHRGDADHFQNKPGFTQNYTF
ncbi:uncharacterized protein V6R79_014704 [Siganus canaliculatus]